MDGLAGTPSVRSVFFDNSPNKTGPCALVHKAQSEGFDNDCNSLVLTVAILSIQGMVPRNIQTVRLKSVAILVTHKLCTSSAPEDDYSQLLQAIRQLPATSIAFEKPESKVMAEAFANPNSF